MIAVLLTLANIAVVTSAANTGNAIQRLLNLIAADQDTPETYEAAAAVDALYQAAKDAAEMCWRCHAKASPETRSERHGQDWCNVCWDRAQPAPRALAAAVRRVEGD